MSCGCPLAPPLVPPVLENLLRRNVQWSAEVRKYDPRFFPALALEQHPKALWIGCSDSRVPDSVVMPCRPGDLFVHRNIANLVYLDDDSAQSVLAYAVDTLKVEHIIVGGHSECGGVIAAYKLAYPDAAMEKLISCTQVFAEPSPHLTHWIRSIVELAKDPQFAPGTPYAIPRLINANIQRQVTNIAKSAVVKGKRIGIHAWLYNLETGLLEHLHTVNAETEVEAE